MRRKMGMKKYILRFRVRRVVIVAMFLLWAVVFLTQCNKEDAPEATIAISETLTPSITTDTITAPDSTPPFTETQPDSEGTYVWNPMLTISEEQMERITNEGIEVRIKWDEDQDNAELVFENDGEEIVITTLGRDNSGQMRISIDDSDFSDAVEHGIDFVLGELESTVTPTAEPSPTPEATPEPAGDVEMSDEAAEAFEAIRSDLEGQFSIEYVDVNGFGAYQMLLVINEVNYHFEEPLLISPGHYAMATADCVFLNEENQEEEVTVLLASYKTGEGQLIGDRWREGQLETTLAVKNLIEREEGLSGAGQVLRIGFYHEAQAGNRSNTWPDGWYDDTFNELYTRSQIDDFARTGYPDDLNLLIPLDIGVQPIE